MMHKYSESGIFNYAKFEITSARKYFSNQLFELSITMTWGVDATKVETSIHTFQLSRYAT